MQIEGFAGRQARRPQAVADYTQGGLTNDSLSYTRKLHRIDGRDRRLPFTAEIKALAKGPSTYDPLENEIGGSTVARDNSGEW